MLSSRPSSEAFNSVYLSLILITISYKKEKISNYAFCSRHRNPPYVRIHELHLGGNQLTSLNICTLKQLKGSSAFRPSSSNNSNETVVVTRAGTATAKTIPMPKLSLKRPHIIEEREKHVACTCDVAWSRLQQLVDLEGDCEMLSASTNATTSGSGVHTDMKNYIGGCGESSAEQPDCALFECMLLSDPDVATVDESGDSVHEATTNHPTLLEPHTNRVPSKRPFDEISSCGVCCSFNFIGLVLMITFCTNFFFQLFWFFWTKFKILYVELLC